MLYDELFLYLRGRIYVWCRMVVQWAVVPEAVVKYGCKNRLVYGTIITGFTA
ncbi:hypothetical protein [Pectinatus frisingensis]|jgi:hypothetical protein|uniref:hypothetical protein n=1 Tax=Pectinatus frisingensis TaxID=865 RepID=UPI003D802E74